ncbi:MAG: glucan biosynthesis protein [Parvibaculaceae bacterium]
MNLTRRGVLNTLQGLAALGIASRTGLIDAAAQEIELLAKAEAFSDDYVIELARARAKKPFVEEKITLPPGFDNLTYDQYRDIRFNPEKSIWRGQPHGFSFDLFHSGFYYTSPVDIFIVNDGEQAKLNYVPDLFTFGPLVQRPKGDVDLHYAGFRLRYPINSKDYNDEFCVFQGASYFRAIGKGHLYGLSARGLAIDTGQPNGEEFPFFRSFWIRTPTPDAVSVVVWALLDSPSATGAYRFTIKPGATTQMDVEMTIFPRRDLEHFGIAPLTSMFLYDAMNHAAFDDYRPAVCDSDGLMMLTGAGEYLWRALANPKTLQVSAFVDNSPGGFGLMQRKRRYGDFLDLEAKYEKRPSLWVEPIGDWGQGAVELYEIPSQREINDNIVAFWQPKQKPAKDSSVSFVYRLYWCDEWPADRKDFKAMARFSGGGLNFDQNKRLYVIDFEGGSLTGDVVADVAASQGTISNVVTQPNPQSGGVRLSFEIDVGNTEMSELKAVLKRGQDRVSETWLYRWTKS